MSEEKLEQKCPMCGSDMIKNSNIIFCDGLMPNTEFGCGYEEELKNAHD